MIYRLEELKIIMCSIFIGSLNYSELSLLSLDCLYCVTGLSRFMGAEDYLETFTYGTITHMPPELLKEGILSPYADVYSFGMLLWELLSKTEHPFPNKNHGEIILAVVNEGRRPHLGTHYPEMYADLIRDCWKQNRADRPNFHEIVRRLKLLLADQEGGNVGSPSKSTSFSMNDSAGSWKKRSDSLKKKLPSQRGEPPHTLLSTHHSSELSKKTVTCWC